MLITVSTTAPSRLASTHRRAPSAPVVLPTPTADSDPKAEFPSSSWSTSPPRSTTGIPPSSTRSHSNTTSSPSTTAVWGPPHRLLLPGWSDRPGAGAQTSRTRPQGDPHRNRTRRRSRHRPGRTEDLLRHVARHLQSKRPQGVPVLQPRRCWQARCTRVHRALNERTEDRDAPITVEAFRTQLKAIKLWGRSTPADLSMITQPTLIANGDNDRMVPTALSEDMHRRIPGAQLIIYPNSGHGAIFQYHREFASAATTFRDS